MCDIKLPINKSPKMSTNYLSTKIIHVTNIPPKHNCHYSPNAREIPSKQNSNDAVQQKCTVYITKSERSRNINVISIKSSSRKMNNDSENDGYQENSMKTIKRPRVEILQSMDAAENVTPENLQPVTKSRIKIEHKSSKKVKEVKSLYLDRNLAYNKEYSEDFIAVQLELDISHKLTPTFLTKNVSAEQRKLSIKNLLKFAAESNYPSYVTFQSVQILDAMIDLKNVKEDWELELINLSALWISLKRLHLFDDIPNVKKLIIDKNETKGWKKLINDCEKEILKTLNFEISFPDPISMVVLCLKNVDDDYPYELMYYTSLYVIELSLLNEWFSGISIFSLVIATTQISLFTAVKGVEHMKHPPWHFWRSQFPKILCAKRSAPDILVESIRKKLIRIALLSQNLDSDYSVVYTKFKTSRYGKVAKLIAKRFNSLSQCEYE